MNETSTVEDEFPRPDPLPGRNISKTLRMIKGGIQPRVTIAYRQHKARPGKFTQEKSENQDVDPRGIHFQRHFPVAGAEPFAHLLFADPSTGPIKKFVNERQNLRFVRGAHIP